MPSCRAIFPATSAIRPSSPLSLSFASSTDAMCFFGSRSTCTGACGLLSRTAMTSSSSNTFCDGMAPATIRQNRQSDIRTPLLPRSLIDDFFVMGAQRPGWQDLHDGPQASDLSHAVGHGPPEPRLRSTGLEPHRQLVLVLAARDHCLVAGDFRMPRHRAVQVVWMQKDAADLHSISDAPENAFQPRGRTAARAGPRGDTREVTGAQAQQWVQVAEKRDRHFAHLPVRQPRPGGRIDDLHYHALGNVQTGALRAFVCEETDVTNRVGLPDTH